MNMLGSNNHTDIDAEISQLVNLFGSSLKDLEQLQQFLQCEKNSQIFIICWLDTRSINLNETSASSKEDDLLEFDF